MRKFKNNQERRETGKDSRKARLETLRRVEVRRLKTSLAETALPHASQSPYKHDV